jgi:hypothetical protein
LSAPNVPVGIITRQRIKRNTRKGLKLKSIVSFARNTRFTKRQKNKEADFNVETIFIGASVNGKPPVSKTGTAGSIPAAPAKQKIELI